jgi:hypothetical protein
MNRLLCSVALYISTAGLALAQYGSQEISGFVVDPSGAVVPHATISTQHQGTGQVRATESDARGYFVFLDVPIGLYQITGEAKGFRRYVQTNVAVTVSAKVSVNIRLTLGELQDSVTTAADALQLETSTGEVGRLITGEQVSDLQLNGRSFAQLLALLPGVSTTNRSPMDLLGGYGSNNAQQSVNGSRRSTLSWNVDGADNKDNGGDGSVFVRVNVDAIAEFKVLTSSYNAEYGQNSGAIVNVALKSGTRDFHGSIYGFTRANFGNGGLNAGGPVYIPGKFTANRNKLFFFTSYDTLNWDSYAWIPNSVPLPDQRTGNFSALPRQLTDPTSGSAFPGNIIPTSRIDRNMARLLANVPAGNTPGKLYQYVSQFNTPTGVDQAIGKVDYHVSDKHRVAAHYMWENYYQLEGQTALTLYDRNIPGTSASAKWTWTPGPRTVNTSQFSVSGNIIDQHNFRPNPEYATDVSRKGTGVDNPMVYGNTWEIPDIAIQGYNIPSVGARSWSNYERVFQWKDDFSRAVGAHILKFGALVMRSRKNQGNPAQLNGSFIFQTGHGLSSGDALADALLGNFYSYSEASAVSEGWFRFTQAEFYAQDDWKVSKPLSLNIGVRGQYMQPWYSALQNEVVFDPAYYDPKRAVSVTSNGQIVPNSGDPLNGLVLGGAGFPKAATARNPGWSDPATLSLFRGLPKEIQATQFPVAPRFGVAYDLTGKQRTVLRGGYGLFFERIQGNAYFSSVNNPPFIRRTTLYSGNVENPTGGKAAPLLPLDIVSYAARAAIPTVQQYNLGVQHRLGRATLLDVSYVGSSAWRLYRGTRPNQLPLGTMLRVSADTDPNSLRPYRGLGTISQFETNANSNYNSLQVQIRKEMLGGGMFSLAYTFSRSITGATDYNTVAQDSYNLRNDRGLSGLNRNHIVTGSHVYPLPFWRKGSRWYQRLCGNWQLSGMVLMETGLPIDLVAAGDPAGIAGTGGSLRPEVVGDWRAGGKTVNAWFNTAAFATPAPGTFGNLGRNALIGPGVINWDGSFQKSFRIRERLAAILRMEYFNALNHVNYWGVDGNMASARFGQVTSTTDRRTVQAMMRLSF